MNGEDDFGEIGQKSFVAEAKARLENEKTFFQSTRHRLLCTSSKNENGFIPKYLRQLFNEYSYIHT